MYRPIRDYGIIGNTRTAALVSSDGSIDWCCLPRFDHPAMFLRLMDDQKGGYCAIHVTGLKATRRRYLPNTNILETSFSTSTGELTVADFMPVRHNPEADGHAQDSLADPRIIRLLRATSGTVDCTFEIRPTFDNARVHARIVRRGAGFRFLGGPESLQLQVASECQIQDDRLISSFRLRAGESTAIVLTREIEDRRVEPLSDGDINRALEETEDYWQNWASECQYQGEHRDAVIRSALALKLLIYEPTGAIVAAPTNSLPEWIGGKRNWDYRYNWLRDSSLTVTALMNLGYLDEARDFIAFLRRSLPSEVQKYQIMYRVTGGTDIEERNLEYLSGYRQSRPVRKGNGALRQTQLDIFGELAHCIYLYWKHPGFDHSGENFERDEWPLLQSCAKYVAKNWQQRGSGIWEMRGPELHHTESKAMCWLLLDRTIKLARDFGIQSPHLDFWKKQRDHLYTEFTTRGYSKKHRAFVQAYDSPVADAALLRLPLLGIVDANDQRMRDTVDFIGRELLDNGLLYRYRQVEDGISGEEGTFTVCSFWLIENYVLQNRLRQAEEMFDYVLSFSNDLKLMSEELDPGNGDLLGNFPQGFTHIGIINAAVRIAKAKEGGVPEAHAVLTAGNAAKAA